MAARTGAAARLYTGEIPLRVVAYGIYSSIYLSIYLSKGGHMLIDLQAPATGDRSAYAAFEAALALL